MKQSITFDRLPEVVGIILESLERIEQQLTEQAKNKTVSDADKALTVKEAAEFLNLAVPTVYSLVSKGLIPYNKKSKRIYFFKNELSDYLHSGKRKTLEEISSETHRYISIRKAG